MFDHVTIRVSDRAASERFYATVLAPLGIGEPSVGGCFVEWGDFSIAADGGPVTRKLHAAFAASDRAAVEEFHRVGVAAGYHSHGEPGLRANYHDDYFGAFLLDPDGNTIEAVCQGRRPGTLDHLSLRTRDRSASEGFYALALAYLEPERYGLEDAAGFLTATGDLWLYAGEPTEQAHIAFAGPDRASVDVFHATLVDAGCRSNGAPGERPEYHAGYYGAFVLDPDGNNVEVVFHDRGER